jgi:hypothetical protein
MKMKTWCSSGMLIPALVGLGLTMVAWPVHLTLRHLTLLRLIFTMMKKMMKVEKEVKMMSEAP